jgi:hypothetical protein
MTKTTVASSIRKNGGSLYLKIPPEFARDNKLEPGDSLLWDPGKTKIIKQGDFTKIALQAATEPV